MSSTITSPVAEMSRKKKLLNGKPLNENDRGVGSGARTPLISQEDQALPRKLDGRPVDVRIALEAVDPSPDDSDRGRVRSDWQRA